MCAAIGITPVRAIIGMRGTGAAGAGTIMAGMMRAGTVAAEGNGANTGMATMTEEAMDGVSVPTDSRVRGSPVLGLH